MRGRASTVVDKASVLILCAHTVGTPVGTCVGAELNELWTVTLLRSTSPISAPKFVDCVQCTIVNGKALVGLRNTGAIGAWNLEKFTIVQSQLVTPLSVCQLALNRWTVLGVSDAEPIVALDWVCFRAVWNVAQLVGHTTCRSFDCVREEKVVA